MVMLLHVAIRRWLNNHGNEVKNFVLSHSWVELNFCSQLHAEEPVAVFIYEKENDPFYECFSLWSKEFYCFLK